MVSTTALPRWCIFFPGALGDFICFLPALEEVLRQNAEVDLFARSEFADLTPPRVKVHSLERYEIRRLFASGAAADAQVVDFFASYAAVYSWTGSGQAPFVDQLRALSGGRARIYPFRSWAGKSHQSDYYLSCIETTHEHASVPAVTLRPDAVAWSENYWAQHRMNGKAVLVLAPGSGAKEKNWPARFYDMLAHWWRDRTGGAVVVLIGPVEEARGGLEATLKGSIVATRLPLAQAAALLARSDLYLGNDSGITHLAAAVGARTVALFGPSELQQWAPRGKTVTVLSRHVDCSPCEMPVMKGCEHRRCLNEFYPAKVIEELEKLPKIAALTRGGAGITV